MDEELNLPKLWIPLTTSGNLTGIDYDDTDIEEILIFLEVQVQERTTF